MLIKQIQKIYSFIALDKIHSKYVTKSMVFILNYVIYLDGNSEYVHKENIVFLDKKIFASALDFKKCLNNNDSS